MNTAQIEQDLATVQGAIIELELVHAEIAVVRQHAATEHRRLHGRAEELLALVQAAKASLLQHGYADDMPEDIQL